MENKVNRRKHQRVPVFFLINCLRADLSRIGGKAYNLSEGGIAIKTNCPINKGEQLTVELLEPESGNVHKVQGEVVWSQFHGDTVALAETLFTVGIRFLTFEGSFRTVVGEFIQESSSK